MNPETAKNPETKRQDGGTATPATTKTGLSYPTTTRTSVETTGRINGNDIITLWAELKKMFQIFMGLTIRLNTTTI